MTWVWLVAVAFALVFAHRLSCRQSWRWAWLDTTLVLALFSVAASEALGSLGLLNRSALVVSWSLFSCAWLVGITKLRFPRVPSESSIPLGLLWGGTALTAGWAAPSNWDSMTYHLARVEHWIDQASLEPYPTSILRQLHSGPGAELLILQVRLLHGSDLFVNWIQWFAYVGCALGVSLLASLLGASWRGQLTAALCAATLPMAVLQSSSTQNDLVVSYWLVAFVCYGLRAESLAHAFSLALGVLTKGTAYLYFPPFAVWLWLRAPGPGRLRWIGMCLLAVCLLNAPAWKRNLTLWRNPLGDNANVRCHGNLAAIMVINGLRNLALEFVLPVHSWNLSLDKGTQAVARALRLDAQMPGATFEGVRFGFPFVPAEERQRRPGWRWIYLTHEDYGSNPLQMGLTLVVLVLSGRRWRGWRLSLLAGWLLMCLGIRWNPWMCRLHLPWMIMACPLLGAYLEGLSERATGVILGALWLCALPPLVANTTRPWFGPGSIFWLERDQQYLSSFPERREDYRLLVARVQGLPRVPLGVGLWVNCGEYPLQALLRRPLRHVQVKNVSAALEAEGRPPEWVIATRPLEPPYIRTDQWGSLSLWHADVSAIP